MADFEKAVEKLFIKEGYKSDDKDDSGGLTIWGIASLYFPYEVKVMASMQPEEAKEYVKDIYKSHYWDKLKGDEIQSQEIAEMLFDMSVNAGVVNTITMMQKTINGIMKRIHNTIIGNLSEDGILGDKTLESINWFRDKYDNAIKNAFIAKRVQYYMGIVDMYPKNAKYLLGWLNRVD